jgi:hypothetical protein
MRKSPEVGTLYFLTFSGCPKNGLMRKLRDKF